MKFKLRTIAAVCCALFCFQAHALRAESTVYVFMKGVGNSDVILKLNGEKISDLNGPVTKRINAPALQMPYVVRDACFRKLILEEEGKALLSVENDFTNANTLAHTLLVAESQVNLTPGSVHYLLVTHKGLTDMQIKPMDEKEAAKLFKKHKELPEVRK